jgi:hypothetical protein
VALTPGPAPKDRHPWSFGNGGGSMSERHVIPPINDTCLTVNEVAEVLQISARRYTSCSGRVSLIPSSWADVAGSGVRTR